MISGTDPANPCDYNPILVTLPQSTGWLLADCDGDGTSNGQEEADGTDPLDPCDVLIQTIQTDPGLPIDDPSKLPTKFGPPPIAMAMVKQMKKKLPMEPILTILAMLLFL